VESSLG
jgi:hypothetical protein